MNGVEERRGFTVALGTSGGLGGSRSATALPGCSERLGGVGGPFEAPHVIDCRS